MKEGDRRPRVGEEPRPVVLGGDARGPTRRRLIGAGGAALTILLSRQGLRAEGAGDWRHGLSIFGDLRYPADFRHFDYVDAAAPKGGSFSNQLSTTAGNQAFDTFNTLNTLVLKGDGAAGMALTTDSLMARAFDEPDAMYGLVAEAVHRSGNSLRFRIRPAARFHDGSPITAADVAWTILTLKEKGHPRIAQDLLLVAGAEAEGVSVVRVDLKPEAARDLPTVVASLPILSSAYWRGRDFEASTLDPPLGSGPYRVGKFEVGRYIAFERAKDYWAADLPVNVGQNNFDEIRFEYFRDRQVAFEAFKSGAFTFREEFTARTWATGYDFPAVKDGKVKRETLPDRTPSGMQGWFFNLRRPQFADPRVREAIGLCFDFEWTNPTVMFGAYSRTESFFENSDLKAEGMPDAAELKLLEPFRGKVPDAVFGEAILPPRSDGSGQDRRLLRRASDLLRAAGCKRDGTALTLSTGEPLAFEFLYNQPVFEPHTQPFIKNLAALGITATSRIVDAAQYQRREEDFDFDVIVQRLSHAPTPGETLRQVFGSAAASTRGSLNLAGIADPVVDALLDAIVQAGSRPALVTAVRALDRVLRSGRYWVPMWYRSTHPLAYWDMFSHPPEPPTYDLGAPATWWFDAEKARRIGRA